MLRIQRRPTDLPPARGPGRSPRTSAGPERLPGARTPHLATPAGPRTEAGLLFTALDYAVAEPVLTDGPLVDADVGCTLLEHLIESDPQPAALDLGALLPGSTHRALAETASALRRRASAIDISGRRPSGMPFGAEPLTRARKYQLLVHWLGRRASTPRCRDR